MDQEPGTRNQGQAGRFLIKDSNGNQILISYQAGAGSGSSDASACISSTTDRRSSYGLPMYQFNHLSRQPHHGNQ